MLRRIDSIQMLALLLFLLSGLNFQASICVGFDGLDDEDNAAYWYERAIRLKDNISRADRELINSISWRSPATDEQRAALRRARPMLEALRRGGQQAYADWGLDYAHGPRIRLGHTGSMFDTRYYITADIIVNTQDGHSSAAVDRLKTLTQLSGHMADDGVNVSSLVGMSFFINANEQITMMLASGSITASQSAEILRTTARLNSDDPFGIVNSISMQQVVFGEWLERTNQAVDGRQQIIDALLHGNNESRSAQLLLGLTEEEFAAGIDAYNDGMDRFVEAFSEEDPEVARQMLEEAEAAMDAGELGFLTNLFQANYARTYEGTLKSKAMLADRIEMLQGIAADEVDLEELINAAVLYMRGVEHLNQLEQPWLDGMAQLAGGEVPDAATLQGLNATYDAARPALAEFSAASMKRRCDFEYLQKREEAFVPPYLVGMQRGVRLLELDTLRRLASRGVDEEARNRAIVELATLFRVTAHLSEDDSMLSALMADEAFSWGAEVLKSAVLVESRAFISAKPDEEDAEKTPAILSEKQYRLLRGSLRWIPTSDPFGYIKSSIRTRQELAMKLRNLADASTHVGTGFPVGSDPFPTEKAEAFVKRCDSAAILMILALLDTVDYRGALKEEGPSSAARVGTFALHQFPALLEDAFGRAPEFMQNLAEKDREDDPLVLSEIEDYVKFDERRKFARRKLRSVVRHLDRFDPTAKPADESAEEEPETL